MKNKAEALREQKINAGIFSEEPTVETNQHDTAETVDEHKSGSSEPTVNIGEPLVTVITMNDIMNHVTDPTLHLVGDGHIVRGRDRVHTIAGYAGVGKSRATSYLAYCGATSKRWFEYEIKHKFKTLFIQSENGMARLKEDFGGLPDDLNGHVFFVDAPRGFDFGSPQFREEIKAIVEDNEIGMVVIDPWTNMVPDIGHKDFNLAIDQVMDCLPIDPSKCPAVMVVAHCRKPDGKGKIKRGSELMHEVYGSHVLTSRSRFVLIVERADMANEADNRVITTCAKANDAEHMPKGCHIRGKVIFDPVDDFDWGEREAPAKAGRKSQYCLSDVVELMPVGVDFKSSDWKEKAIAEYGISKSRFHEFQSDAVRLERVIKLKDRGPYRRPS